MTKFGFLSFVLFCWISSCQGKILSPPPGTSFTFLPGETRNIIWTFDDSESDLASRDWFFLSSSNGSQSRQLALVFENSLVQKSSSPSLPNFDVYKPSTLELRNITHSYDGTYEFQLRRKGDSLPSFISKVRVFVAIKPTIVLRCLNPLVLNESDNVLCVCREEGGNPPANVTWFDKNNNIIGDVGVVNKTLVITNVTLNDGGNYTCKTQSYDDPRFIDEKSLEIKLNYKPRSTILTISKTNAIKGQTVTITCESDGFPLPTYTIYHNDAVVSNNKTYIIQSVNFNHAGSYRCEAKNKLGNDLSHLQNLTVIKVLEISSSISRSRPFFTSTSTSINNNLKGNLTSTSRTFDNCKTCKITETKTKWYIVLVTLISGIIVGIFITSLLFLRYRKRWVSKKRKQPLTNAEGRVNTVDSTYEELDLSKMDKEDNYQSLRPKDETVDKTYQELNLSKMNNEDNYQSLRGNDKFS